MTPGAKENSRRKRFVRRIFKRMPLHALWLIRERYPDYQEENLLADLVIRYRKKRSFRRKKDKKGTYFRNEQIRKYAMELRFRETWEPEYDKACQQIAMLTQAENEHRDIKLLVKIGSESKYYHFKHYTRECFIKDFITAANKKGSTHDELEELRCTLIDRNLGRGMR